ncbi:EcsC family protein [Bacillus suaedaesalsae]|uniref:EcsC family protein n=1 Tax=Bacillus suaedaesalsae TaxID=2810349 RepID=A0ABS2DI08_9BACI|nr:EcsC family protein [Bacillus suaedaesalsae]MBM6617201.1 EcsC family protein [Bacillus suaedaesalsae]
MNYEMEKWQEALAWKRKLIRKPSMFARMSKSTQTKVQKLIPQKAHEVITQSIKQMVELTMTSSEYLPKSNYHDERSFQEKELLIQEKLKSYKKMAALEGAGTGAGGLILGIADFPLLLAIKMKFLFEIGAIHGLDTKSKEERVFLLTIFQLAFSSEAERENILGRIEGWQERENVSIDWQKWQQDYRDHIDLVKMLQLVPGIGAVVGAYANYHLLDLLGETAIQCFRLRLLNQ